MKITIPLFLFGLLSGGISNAQSLPTDSGYIDLGQIRVQKDFTQLLTIKGKDLERFPFSSLEEAINVYFYGAYIDKSSVIYVIDGNPTGDVNAYSIYDIESITLVQNAAAILHGAGGGRHLILIQTKTGNSDKKGFTIAANSYLVNSHDDQQENTLKSGTSPDFYHQVYLSANQQYKRFRFGASANILRDIFPSEITATKLISSTPLRSENIRINAWATAAVGRKSELTIRFNAAPQKMRSNAIFENFYHYIVNESSKTKIFQINPSVKFTSRIGKSWVNELNINYYHSSSKQDDFRGTSPNVVPPTGMMTSLTNDKRRFKDLIIRNHIYYEKQIKSWKLKPSLSLLYQLNQTYTENNEKYLENNTVIGIAGRSQTMPSRAFIAAPYLDITYREIFAVQGGMQIISQNVPMFSQKTNNNSPFYSASIDVLELVKQGSINNLKIFSSFAKSATTGESIYFSSIFPYDPATSEGVIRPSHSSLTEKKDYKLTVAGATFGLKEDLLKFSYTFEKADYPIEAELGGLSNFPPIISEAKIDLNTHRFSIEHAPRKNALVYWQTGIIVSGVKSHIQFIPDNQLPGLLQRYYPRTGWSGGWNNHFRYKNITAGINGMYFLNEQMLVAVQSGSTPRLDYVIQKSNSLLLQHLYVGYTISSKKCNSEIYISARNLFENKKSTRVSGSFAYTGIGFKMEWK